MALAGTSTAALLALRASEVARGVGNTHPIFTARAKGAHLWDTEGNHYLDFAGGIGVLNVGHAHPKVRAAVAAQLERFTHTCFQVTMYEDYVRLCERLNALGPGPSKKKTLLVTTGAEATENAVKIARAHTGRAGVIAFNHSFHGRTLLALTMTGKNDPYKQQFGPYCSEIYFSQYPYEHHGWTTKAALAALDDVFEAQIAPDRVAAIIIEPVLGEGGFVPAPVEFMRELRRIADAHGIVLICDEIQSGFCRTGRFFAVEHAGIEPDLLTIAKSVADGLPLAGVIGRAEIMDAVTPGGLGGTYGGNPLACAAALATLDVIEEEQLVERAAEIGVVIERSLRDLQRRHAQIEDVRGRGAMLGMEFVDEPNAPRSTYVKRIIDEARNRGLLLLSAGHKASVIRILVPLVVSDEDLATGLSRLDESCAAVLN
ncbi:MAG TPA: 4-aminobutyrate--2-oxoglutarate transaminase [Candidatus Eremiobacteraceae bacterium]|nr:4-aminobutyrate--2-oxoglutarate transaminase [Candidatus Eremiobacteraceae bacterium]